MIKMIKLKTSIFGDDLTKNRRLKPKELEDELFLARMFKRPVRSFIRDKPTYNWLPPTPLVQFNLNFKE